MKRLLGRINNLIDVQDTRNKKPIGYLYTFPGLLHVDNGITSSLVTAVENGADIDGEVFVTKAGIRYTVHREKPE